MKKSVSELSCIIFDQNIIENISNYFNFNELNDSKSGDERLNSYRIIKRAYEQDSNYQVRAKHLIRDYIESDYNRIIELSMRCKRFTNRSNHKINDYFNKENYYVKVIISEYENIKFGITSFFIIDSKNKYVVDICISCRIISDAFIKYITNYFHKEGINTLLFERNKDNYNFEFFFDNELVIKNIGELFYV